jgi:hypothetical protein
VNETEITEEQVRHETIDSVDVLAHYLYLAGVIGGSFLAMVVFIALLGALGS